MATKRSHSTYTSDALLSTPYTTYGTPLPPSPSSRDDGTYLPLWKQEVRDERGRKRLHGAFTGGFSAGYFNTVGSKEGWTPSTFVSSRGDRRKDDGGEGQKKGMRPEDFMDEEDLAEREEGRTLKTKGAFAGLGDEGREEGSRGGLMGLFRAEGDTMGTKLLRRMGWKDGQGIGPKIRRGARLDMTSSGGDQTYLFAPDNASMITFTRKTDRKGLGHSGETKLSSTSTPKHQTSDDEDEVSASERNKFSLAPPPKIKPAKRSTGIGVGILNDDGSDEEDPYAVGPKITYNRILNGDKKKKKQKKPKETVAVNPSLGNAPVFRARGLRKCHDGRLPLDGFILARVTEDLSNLLVEYAPPVIPEGWKPSKQQESSSKNASYESTTTAAKTSTHDPKSRASLLGETPLPSKSVFDYLTPSVRAALASASGKTNLPPAMSEIPESHRLTPSEKHTKLWEDAAKVDKDTAIAALGRTNGGPYADNEAKRERYQYYLSACAYPTSYPAPDKKKGDGDDNFVREMGEFYACAGIFKPLTGSAASRFTSASTILGAEQQTGGLSSNKGTVEPVVVAKPSDPAMEAAKMGMFGRMTRSVEDWYPTRLLCKRFNVKVPEHVQVDGDAEKAETSKFAGSGASGGTASGAGSGVKEMAALPPPPAPSIDRVDPEKNEAVEGGAAHAEVLKAIFGDSDSE